MLYGFIQVLLVIMLQMLVLYAPAAASKITPISEHKLLVYLETSGSTSVRKEYVLSKNSDGYHIQLTEPDAIQNILSDLHCHTYLEHYADRRGSETITARRDNEKIIFSGNNNGKSIDAKVTVGEDLWYGSKLLLFSFVLSERTTEFFYMTRPEDQKAIRLKAVKEDIEKITVQGKAVSAVKVSLTLPGYRFIFWKSVFWFRNSDGILLKSKEMRGPPWSGKTIVELIYEK